MPGIYSSQGTSVTFNGVMIGYLTDVDVDGSAASLVETTPVEATVIGSGVNSRVMKTYDCLAIEPITISISFRGPPTYTENDSGLRGLLVIVAPGSPPRVGNAILTGWTHRASAGEYSSGTATFQMTGN